MWWALNYAGKFDAFASEGPAAHPRHAYVHVDSAQTHAPANALIVPDAQLLFHADYSRSGADLILSKDDHRFVLHDYFSGDRRVPLASPDGAHLTTDIIKALVGEVDVAQAGDAPAASHVIGHVTKLQGSATVIRNGVSVILNMGDNVEKGDVVQSGANSTLGITFIDGTVFGLGSNARMVLNDMVYDPHGSNNSSLLSLVAGTITFVAGETAKHGDMKVDTPVATMGIRGTAVLVEIDFDVPGQNGTPNASFQVLVEPDGTTGSYILFDKTTLQPIAIVNQAGEQININNGVISQTTVPLSPDIQKLITDVFQQKFTDNDTNTKTTSPTNDTLTPQNGPLIKLANGTTAQPVYVVTGAQNNAPPPPSSNPSQSSPHVDGPPHLDIVNLQGLPATQYFFAEIPGKTHDAADPDTVKFTAVFDDINRGDNPTVSASFHGYSYKNAQGQDVTASLSALQQADIAQTAIKLAIDPAAGNSNAGTVSLTYSLADSNFDFLAAGEQLTLTYDITVNNNYGPNPESKTVEVTITIVGTNDAPVITTAAPTIDFAAGTSTPGGTLQSKNPTSGTLNFNDVDLTDTHTVATKLVAAVMSNGGTIPPLPEKLFENALSASIGTDSTGTGNGVIDWQLAPLPVYIADFIPKGQSVTLTYDVTVTDSQGAVSTQTVTVTITGTDNAAVVWVDTGAGGGSWNDAANWGTGAVPTASDDAIIITNQLLGLTPSYPVTVDHDAAAHSLTLNDFGSSPPTLINDATLAIGAGGLNVSADSIIENQGTLTVAGAAEFSGTSELQNSGAFNVSGALQFADHSVLQNSGSVQLGAGGDFKGSASITNSVGGTITVAGAAEFVDNSMLQNSGLLLLDNGGDFRDFASITNSASGTIEVAGGTLNLLVDIANQYGHVTVDAGATLSLATEDVSAGNNNYFFAGEIDGGTVTILGTLEFQEDGDALQNGTLINSGLIESFSFQDALINETVTNNNKIEVASDARLWLEGSTVTGAGTIESDDAGTLVVQGTTIDGGTITNDSGGTLWFAGGADLKDGSIGNSGLLQVDGYHNSLDNEAVNNGDTIEIQSGGALTIDQGSIVTNDGTIQIDQGPFYGTLTVNGATVDGGSITADGFLFLTGSAVLKNGSLQFANPATGFVQGLGNALHNEKVSGGSFALASGTELTIDQGSDVKDSELSLNTATLTLNDATAENTTIANDASGGTVDLTGQVLLQGGAIVNALNFDVSGTQNTLDGESISNLLSGVMEINGDLTLKNNSSITNEGAANTETVESTGTLTLNNATITGGIVTNHGTIDSTGGGAIDNANITNTSMIESTAGIVTIDPDAQTFTLTNSGTVQANGGELDITGEQITNTDALNAVNGGTLKLSDLTVTNTDGTVTVGHNSTLDLASAGITGGDVSNSGTLDHVTGTDTITADITNTGTFEVTGGTLTIGAQSKIANDGNVQASGGGTFEIDGSIDNAGTIAANGGIINIAGAVCGTGSATIASGGILHFSSTVAATQTVTFEDATGALAVADTADFQATIDHFGAGNTIDLTGISFTAGEHAVWTQGTGANAGGGTLTIYDADGNAEASLNLHGTYTTNNFTLASDGAGTPGTDIQFTTASPAAPTVTIQALTPNGLDLSHQDVLAEMGAGTVQDDGSSTTFTVVDSADHVQFVINGTGLTFDGTTVTGGTITSFEELTTDPTPVALGNFTGFSVNAATWVSDVQQDAAGNKTPINTVLGTYSFDFIGGPGNDSVGLPPAPAGSHDSITGGGGNDTFYYQQGDGALVITDFDQGGGSFNASEDTLVLSGFSGQPTFTYANGNTIADFGNGDVLTLLGITQQEAALINIQSNNGSGNNNGPVIGDANNSVTYQGTPVLIDPSVTLSDPEATVSSVNVWISHGSQAGDELTINGNLDGEITNADGSIIHYHFDNSPGTNNGQGPGIFLSNIGTTAATTADFQAALQLIQFSSTSNDPTAGGSDNSRTITWAAYDNTNFSPIVTTTVNLNALGVTVNHVLTFTTLDDPGTFNTQPGGINDAGIIVGGSAADANHQIAWEYVDGAFIQMGASLEAQDVTAHAINNNDIIVGDFSPVRSTPRYGFIDGNGTFTTVTSDSPGQSTNANGINDHGVVVGSDYLHSGARYTGYIYSDGAFTYFNVPGTDNPNGDTFADGINNEGLVVGSYNPDATNANGYHGFVYDSVHGTFTDISDPLGVKGTFASAINDHGQVVGWYVDANGVDHGFIESGGIYTTIDDPLGVKGTVVTGINNSDQIVGYTVDANGNDHGFETTYSTTVTAEDTPLVLNSVNVSDAAAGDNTIKVQLAVAHGTLALNNSNGVSVLFDDSHDTMTLTGSTAAIDAALGKGMVYTPDNGFTGNDTLTVTANDEGHNSTGTPQTTTQTLDLTVHGGPVIETDKLVVTQNDDDHHTTTVTGLQINDSDAAASTETFTLSATTEASDSHVTPSTETGSLSQLNSALDSITYDPGANRPATDMVTLTVTDQSGATDTVHFVFNEGDSDTGNVTLTGTIGNDVIFATGGSDTLTGNGGIDQFVFKPSMPDANTTTEHTITDFDVNHDTIDLRQFVNVGSWTDVTATAQQQGSDTLLTLDNHETLLLKNVLATNLHASDFIVTPHTG